MQRKIDVIGTQLIDLGIAVEAIPDRVASDFCCLLQIVVFRMLPQVISFMLDRILLTFWTFKMTK